MSVGNKYIQVSSLLPLFHSKKMEVRRVTKQGISKKRGRPPTPQTTHPARDTEEDDATDSTLHVDRLGRDVSSQGLPSNGRDAFPYTSLDNLPRAEQQSQKLDAGNSLRPS